MSLAEWVSAGKVRARITDEGALEVRCHGLTPQAKYYKTLLKEFFRKEFPPLRPGYGDYSVHIMMEYTGDAPWMDLDNLAKALLDKDINILCINRGPRTCPRFSNLSPQADDRVIYVADERLTWPSLLQQAAMT